MTTYSIWTGRDCVAKDVDRDSALAVLTSGALKPDVAAEFLEQAGPPGSLALERYGFTVMVDERNGEDA